MIRLHLVLEFILLLLVAFEVMPHAKTVPALITAVVLIFYLLYLMANRIMDIYDSQDD